MAHAADALLETDIDAYLTAHENKSLLRFITCGSVDDGKSTLIGRLLYETKLVFEDHMAALEVDSRKVGTQGGDLDFALLLDGLEAEREQGITIDVAYRFFSIQPPGVRGELEPERAMDLSPEGCRSTSPSARSSTALMGTVSQTHCRSATTSGTDPGGTPRRRRSRRGGRCPRRAG